jgi:hypothetical protein
VRPVRVALRHTAGVRRVILVLGLGILFGLPGQAAATTTATAPTVVHVWRVNLDGDGHIEKVQLMLALKPNPFGGTEPIRKHWLEVVDSVGGHTVTARISPMLDHLFPRWVQIANLNARGRPEIFYHGFNGGAGSVPVSAGIRGWNGTGRVRYWSYSPPYPVITHKGHRYFYDFANVSMENLVKAAAPGLEVHLVQGERLASEADCCPSRALIRNYRFDPAKHAWVLYQTVWKVLVS